MLKVKLLFMVVVEDLMRFFENICLILSTGLLPGCSLVRAIELAHDVVDLLPPLLTVHQLSPVAAFNLLACRKVGGNARPESA